ncbi:hypothetical protein C8R47DRAFT_1147699 [Mycena vitilis]|nr:hypothetical protein C8R47DRAFT_1147699 [Mycena vitilis]
MAGTLRTELLQWIHDLLQLSARRWRGARQKPLARVKRGTSICYRAFSSFPVRSVLYFPSFSLCQEGAGVRIGAAWWLSAVLIYLLPFLCVRIHAVLSLVYASAPSSPFSVHPNPHHAYLARLPFRRWRTAGSSTTNCAMRKNCLSMLKSSVRFRPSHSCVCVCLPCAGSRCNRESLAS